MSSERCGWFDEAVPQPLALASPWELLSRGLLSGPSVAASGHGGGGAAAWGAGARASEYVDAHGCTFTQLFQAIPALAPLYPLRVENEFNALSWSELFRRLSWLPLLTCAAYCLACVVGVRLMARASAPFSLRGPLRAWNLGLALFSAVGFLRTAPHLIWRAATFGFEASVCEPAEPSFGHGASGLWLLLFVLSKFPELVDTAFIVLKRGDLIFLHWYHHITVLLFCWHSYATHSSMGMYFCVRSLCGLAGAACAGPSRIRPVRRKPTLPPPPPSPPLPQVMNYGVHALMYFYYYLRASGYKPSWDWIVTALQISQMFAGMAVCGGVAVFKLVLQRPCNVQPNNLLAGGIMYASYAALFIFFAAEKYITGKSSLQARPRVAAAKPKGE